MLRDLLVDEVNTIFDRQQALGNAVADDDLREAYLAIMTAQRSFDMGPGGESPYALDGFGDKVGFCTLEREEKRAPKAAYTAEYFNVLQKINIPELSANLVSIVILLLKKKLCFLMKCISEKHLRMRK